MNQNHLAWRVGLLCAASVLLAASALPASAGPTTVYVKGHFSIHAAGAVTGVTYVVSGYTPGWTCTDSLGKNILGVGQLLPSPKMTCTPPDLPGVTNKCVSAGTLAYSASTTLGQLGVSSACDGFGSSQTVTFPNAGGKSYAGPNGNEYDFPLVCSMDDHLVSGVVDWWAHCYVNEPA